MFIMIQQYAWVLPTLNDVVKSLNWMDMISKSLRKVPVSLSSS